MTRKLAAPPPSAVRRSGTEPFREGSRPLGFSLGDFWAWSSSEVLGNTLRGIVAEYLVAQALGVADGCRTEWEPYDLRSREGVTVEVKSAAYLQAWAQRGPSTPSFSIAPTLAGDSRTGTHASTRRRQAQVYVFALLHHADRATVDPLDVTQWVFYVLPTKTLDERLPKQKNIRLSTLLGLDPIRSTFERLADSVALSGAVFIGA